MFNATVNNFLGLNIRMTRPSASGALGVDVGDLRHLQRIRLQEPIIDYQGTDGLVWVELELPVPGWVAKKYLIVDPITTIPGIDEKAIRLDELSKIETYMQAYFTNRRNEINL